MAKLTLAAYVAGFVVGCAGDPVQPDAPQPPAVTDDASVFAGAWVRTYELSLPEDDWVYLLEHARDEEYIPAQLAVGGEPFGTVGLRAKGAFGTLHSCFDDDELVCDKLSIKLRFDKYDEDLRLGGLKRLNFHSMVRDPSLLRERVAYDLFQRMGMRAPRSAHAQVTVNGSLLGLFALVEQVDEVFLASRFPEDPHGRLYKDLWPRKRTRENFLARLKSGNPEGRLGIEDLADDMAGADHAALPGMLGERMDLEALAMHVAVDESLANWDGVRRFSCGANSCTNHNFYVYEFSDARTFALIPWDYDIALPTNQTRLDGVPHWSDLAVDCDRRYPDRDGRTLMAPSCDPVFRGLAMSDRTRIAEIYARVKDGPFEENAVAERIRDWAELLMPYVKADPDRRVRDFRSAVDKLVDRYLAAAHEDLEEAIQLIATPIDALPILER